MRTLQTILFLSFCSITAAACSSETEGKDNDPDGTNSGEGEGEVEGDGDGNGDDVDDDGDGFTEAQGDCDDDNDAIHPGADEYCNNVDDDCDGAIDDPTSLAEGQGETAWADADGDGYGDRNQPGVACEFSEGWAYNDLDCDDDHATANPDGTEVNFNGIDEDCDGIDYSLDACLEEAMANTAAEMENTGRGVEVLDFYNTYDLTTTWPLTYTFTGAGYGEVTNQVAYIRDLGYLLSGSDTDYNVNFETDLKYNDAAKQFIMTVGVVPSYWTAGAFGYTLGDIMTYLVDLVADLPDNWDGTFSCYGYVDPTPADFDGDMVLTIDERRGVVTADVTLESNVTSFTEGDTTLTNIDGGQCSNDIITAITGYMGIGDTYVFMNENLVQVGKELVFTYESTLESNVAASCSR